MKFKIELKGELDQNISDGFPELNKGLKTKGYCLLITYSMH